MKLFVCLHNQLGAISRLRYLSESASHLLSLLVSESIFQLSLPPPLDFIYLFIYLWWDFFAWENLGLEGSQGSGRSLRGFRCAQGAWTRGPWRRARRHR